MIKQTYLIICILLGIWFTACQDDDPIENSSVVDGDLVEVSIKTNVPAITVQTKADATDAEKKLTHVDVLVFEVDKDDDEKETFVYRTTNSNILGDPDSENAIEIRAKLNISKSGEKYRIVFIANLKEEVNDFFETNESGYIGKSKIELLESLTFTQEKIWTDTDDQPRPLPMWGETPNVTTITKDMASSAFGNVKLLRSIARIGLSVSLGNDPTNDGSDIFEIISVRVYNAPKTGLAAPDPDNLNNNGEAEHPTVVINSALFNNETDDSKYILPTNAGNKVTGIYINEASNQQDGEEVFLIIEAIYKGKESTNQNKTFYKVGFYDDEKNPKDILRNVTYNMIITAVTGEGEEKEEDAVNSTTSNLTVSMTEWSNGEMKYVVFNGKYYLAVSENELILPKPEATHELKVKTNYPDGWKASISKGSEWINNLSPGSGPQNEDDDPPTPFSFSVSENTEANRDGKITLSCGEEHLTLDINITQTTEMVYTLKIWIDNPDYPNSGEEFIEFDRVITFPSGYHYRDDENLTPRTLKIEWSPGVIPLNLEFNPYFAWGEGTDTTSIHNTNGVTTFTVVPKKLSERSQEEWYPEAVGDIQVQIGEESTTQQNVLIRRRHYEVYIEKADRYVIESENDSHSFKLYSNTKWKAILPSTSAFTDNDEPILQLEKDEGDSNVIGGNPGEDIYFTLSPSLLDVSFASTVPVTIEFEDADGRIFSKDYDFEIYHSAEPPGSDTKFGGKANCYVIHTKGTNGKPHKVSIPVIQANEATEWNTNKITKDMELKSKFIWTDHPNGQGPDSPVHEIEIVPDESEGDARNARLIVTAGTQPGNAVVAITNNGGDILWSWHIWVVDDENFDPDDDDSNWPGYRYYRFMDRNLGALSNDPADITSGGLYYQWGRKDPFPVSGTDGNTKSEMYDQNGNPINWINNVYAANTTDPTEGLNYSIKNPQTYMSPTWGSNWLSTSWAQGLGDNLWNEMENGSLSTSKKGVFDPCPDGWKTIPGGHSIANDWTMLFQNLTYVEKGSNAYSYSYSQNVDAGKWPHTGYIDRTSRQRTSTTDGRYWTATNNEMDVAYHFRFQKSSNHASEAYQKTCGLPVRCMRRSDILKTK
ncbi:MAG: fimbrial protein [Tannerellaceae bacterium]|nr:fimbrial protein [Tannerellaceae bacterium]